MSAISSDFSFNDIGWLQGTFENALDSVASKTQSIWGQIYGFAWGGCVKVTHVARSAIGSVFRDVFFFPLKCSWLINRPALRDQLNIEDRYYRDFWDQSKPLDPNLRLHEMIREKFDVSDRPFSIQLKNGSIVEITCRVMETKEKGDNFYNFVLVPGNFSTISNNIGSIYPYLAAYLNAKKSSLPARFIVISEHNLNYKPDCLDEAGHIMLETLKAVHQTYGTVNQLVAHSLGTILLANALKQVDDSSFLPKNICLDRGPTSVWEISKKYLFGSLLYLFIKIGGWASDIEQDIVDFYEKLKGKACPALLITGVLQDHHFSGGANLCLGEKIKKIEHAAVLVFDPPRQLIHEHAHHNLRSDYLNPRYLITDSCFMKSLENLPEAIIRHSIAY